MFSPVYRRVEQEKTVFRHRLFFVLCFRAALWGRALSQIRRASALPPEERRAVGNAANLMGGRKRRGGESRCTFFSRGGRGGAFCFFGQGELPGGGVLSSGSVGRCSFRGQSVMFCRKSATCRTEARDRGRSGVRCRFRTHAPVLPLENRSAFCSQGRRTGNTRAGQSCGRHEGQKKEKKKKMNKIAWLTAWQNFHH